MVIAMLAVVVVVSMVVMVPVAFVEFPSLLIMVIVGMAPITSLVGWTIPASADPYVTTVIGAPIAVNPLIACAGGCGTPLVAQRWRCSADVDTDLTKSRGCECCGNQCCA